MYNTSKHARSEDQTHTRLRDSQVPTSGLMLTSYRNDARLGNLVKLVPTEENQKRQHWHKEMH